MGREINTRTLDLAAHHYAEAFLNETRRDSQTPSLFVDGPEYVMQNMQKFAYKDEFEYVRDVIRDHMGSNSVSLFDTMSQMWFTPRSDKVFEQELERRLAVDIHGDHKEGHIGTTQVGQRTLGQRWVEVELPWSIRRRKLEGLAKQGYRQIHEKLLRWWWPIYAGEHEERMRPGGGVADEFPQGALGMAVGAASMSISNECAILACDAVVDNLDEGTGAAVIKLYAASRATDPDTAVGGQVLLGTCVMSDPAFGGASEAAPGATATASAITADSSADATDTAAWFRVSSTNDGATPLDDHIDGNVGTSGEDMNLNTVAIVTGATITISSYTVTMPES
jgi:hypothetical protein